MPADLDTAPLFLPSNINSVKDNSLPRMPRTNKSLLGENGHWEFDQPMYSNKQIGFIYGIRSRHNNKLYIGKKLYAGMGKLNKGVESNWKYYVSSNKEIDAIARVLRDRSLDVTAVFDFICLEEYSTKGGLSFAEVWCLVTAEIPSNRDIFYNSLINGISWPVKERVTIKNKQRLMQFIAGEI